MFQRNESQMNSIVSPLRKSSISCIKDCKHLKTRPEVQKLGSLLIQDTSHKAQNIMGMKAKVHTHAQRKQHFLPKQK